MSTKRTLRSDTPNIDDLDEFGDHTDPYKVSLVDQHGEFEL